MHGVASTRVARGLSVRRLAGAPQRLLTAQPASPWFPILFYTPIAAAAITWNLFASGVAWWEFVALPIAGLLLWTLLEYVIHSVGFHWPTRSQRWREVQLS